MGVKIRSQHRFFKKMLAESGAFLHPFLRPFWEELSYYSEQSIALCNIMRIMWRSFFAPLYHQIQLFQLPAML